MQGAEQGLSASVKVGGVPLGDETSGLPGPGRTNALRDDGAYAQPRSLL